MPWTLNYMARAPNNVVKPEWAATLHGRSTMHRAHSDDTEGNHGERGNSGKGHLKDGAEPISTTTRRTQHDMEPNAIACMLAPNYKHKDITYSKPP